LPELAPSRRWAVRAVSPNPGLWSPPALPAGEYDDFMTGFVVSDKQVWGRPVGVAVAQDGSLFVTEDGNGTIWRITHQRTASQ
jgi:hypothetical protein